MDLWRHYLSVSWRKLLRHRANTLASAVGLTMAFAAALLIAASVNEDLSYDTFIPGHSDVYLLANSIVMPGREPIRIQRTPLELGRPLAAEHAQIEAVARLRPMPIGLRAGEVEDNETIYWADPDFFAVLPLPVTSGSLEAALARPDGIVISRRLARQYFGRDDVVGERVELDRRHAATVMAVIEDLPPSSHLDTDIFGSSLSPISLIYQQDQRPPSPRWFTTGYTYVRLKPGEPIEALAAAMPAFVERQKPLLDEEGTSVELRFVPLTDIHLDSYGAALEPGTDRAAVLGIGAIGLLTVLLATINFVSLTAVRAVQRTGEVAVRRILGAGWRNLAAQFFGEAFGLALCCAAAAVLAALLAAPALATFLGMEISPAAGRSTGVIAVMLALPLVVGAATGSYAALASTRLSPAAVLRTGALTSSSRGFGRAAFVALNFAIVIGLVVLGGTMYQQVAFALREALRVDIDQVLLIETNCQGPIKDEMRALDGVRGVSCSWLNGVTPGPVSNNYAARDGQQVVLSSAPIDYGYLELYGIEPLAGRLFSEDFADAVSNDPQAAMDAPLVVNASAARLLGFANPAEAVGTFLLQPGVKREARPSEIVGVVPDFAFEPIRAAVTPMVYFVWPAAAAWMHVKLDGARLPETLAAIDRVWNEVGTTGRPISRFFLDGAIEDLYADLTRQTKSLGLSAIVALAIACLGLFGLSAYIVERRMREMSIRKVLGAGKGTVLGLTARELLQPLLYATLLGWAAGYAAAKTWLGGFAYRIEPDPKLFVLAAAAAASIALLVTLTHLLRLTRAHPAALQRCA